MVVLMVLFSQPGKNPPTRRWKTWSSKSAPTLYIRRHEQQPRYRGVACQGEDHQEVPRQGLRVLASYATSATSCPRKARSTRRTISP